MSFEGKSILISDQTSVIIVVGNTPEGFPKPKRVVSQSSNNGGCECDHRDVKHF